MHTHTHTVLAVSRVCTHAVRSVSSLTRTYALTLLYLCDTKTQAPLAALVVLSRCKRRNQRMYTTRGRTTTPMRIGQPDDGERI